VGRVGGGAGEVAGGDESGLALGLEDEKALDPPREPAHALLRGVGPERRRRGLADAHALALGQGSEAGGPGRRVLGPPVGF
jgi:hypothetical protein